MQVAATLARKPPQAGQLLRVLGLAFALAVGVGTVVGGGILRTPAVVFDAVPHAGFALGLWLAVGLHCLLQANVVSELMTALPRAGGLFVPARAAFGEPGGLLVGWTDWLGYIAAVAALSILASDFTVLAVPPLASYVTAIAVGFLAVFIAINWLGVREGSTAQIIGSAAKMLFLVALVMLILFSRPIDSSALGHAVGPIGATGIIVAYQTIFGGYTGFSNVAYFAEEDQNPSRNIPRGMFMTVLAVMALYCLISAALYLTMSPAALAKSTLPIADALAPVIGPFAFKLIAIGAVLIALTCLNANLMGAPRILYGLAEQRMFPTAALRVNRGGTPSVALALSAAAALGLTLTGQFATVFLIMAALGIVPFVVADFALFKLRREAPELARPYRAKLYPWLPALALLLDVGMLIAFLAADWTSGLFIVAAVAICVPIGLWMRRNQPEPIALGG
ncbi:APC family permease [Sphingomonas sp.]|uniref:APC family permease n=1 Tax=Sphingomonas sp. TaxID=28214 RepID=UPI0018021EF8|nr:APC family permease [Sphingomonas sp.]MBA3512060.1 APC family permease [Sphingomonas sp.]